MSSRQTDSGWKKLLLDAKRHYANLATNLYKLTKALVALYDDAEFRAEIGARNNLEEWIDQEFPGLPFRFVELRAILEHYPKEKDWAANKLSVLADAIPEVETEKKERKKPERITKKEFDALVREKEHYQYRAEFLDGRVKELEEELAAARGTIARLEGRLEEVERLQRVA